MALLFKVPDARGIAWQSLLQTHAPDIDLRLWPEIGEPSQVRYFAAWQPPQNLHERFPNLEVIFATSAGVDQFDLGDRGNDGAGPVAAPAAQPDMDDAKCHIDFLIEFNG